jgi:hypothetical protein
MILHLTKEWAGGPRRYPLSSSELKKELGLPPKLPKGALLGAQVGDTKVYVISQETARIMNPGVIRPHRVIAICECGKHVPAGKLQQHRKAHR